MSSVLSFAASCLVRRRQPKPRISLRSSGLRLLLRTTHYAPCRSSVARMSQGAFTRIGDMREQSGPARHSPDIAFAHPGYARYVVRKANSEAYSAIRISVGGLR